MIALVLASSLYAQSIAPRDMPTERPDNSKRYVAAIVLTAAADVVSTHYGCSGQRFDVCEANPLFRHPDHMLTVNAIGAAATSTAVVILEKKGKRSAARGVTAGWVVVKAALTVWNVTR